MQERGWEVKSGAGSSFHGLSVGWICKVEMTASASAVLKRREFVTVGVVPARDLVFWAGLRYSGLTLKELGDLAGGVDYTAVANAIKRVEARAQVDNALRRAMKHVRRKCEAEKSDL